MKYLFPLLLLAGLWLPKPSLAQQQYIICNTTTAAYCNTTSNPGNGQEGDPAWLSFGKTNANFTQIYTMLGNTGTLPLPVYGSMYNNNGTLGSLLPGATGTWCFSWTSLSAPPTLVSCGAGSGTVTSIGITVPSWLSVSPSSIATSGIFAITGAVQPNNYVLASAPNGTPTTLTPRALVAADIPTIPSTSVSGLGTFATQNFTTPPAIGAVTPAAGTFSTLADTSVAGTTQCLHANASGVISGTGADCASGSSGVSTVSGDGSLISNASSSGSVTLTLANTGVGYGVFGSISSFSSAPSYHALSTFPAAAFPTLNQNTTGNAATATALASTPTQCTSGQHATGINANGSANCASPTGVTSFSGDGTLLSNSANNGAVTATLASTGVGYGVFGTTNSSSSTPSYHALTAYPTAAFPTLNQNTTGNAATATAFAATPTQCSGGQVATGITVLGAANCSGSVNGTTIPTSATLLVSGGALGTPSSGLLTNATGLPVLTGISGLGTGVASALAVNTGTAGSHVVNGGALGTPSSGVATNLTGTATALNIGGNAATATNLASYPGICTGGQFSTGLSSGSNNCATPVAGNVSTAGTPTQYGVGIWASGTTIGSVSPSATVGEALVSNGASTNPIFSTSLAGVTSVNSSTVPASTVLDGLSIAQTFTAAKTFTNSDLLLLGSSTGATTFTSANTTTTPYTITIPAVTDTLVTLNATQTLTNKSIASGEITGLGTFATQNYATPPAIGGVTPAAGAFTTLSATGNITTSLTGSTQCLQVNSAGVIGGTGAACGSGGGSSAFSALTSGTNTAAAMVVGSGASISATGGGSISANQLNGTSLSGLATGLLKNTTSTGIPSIAASADVISLFSGTCNSTTVLMGNGSCSAGTPIPSLPSYSTPVGADLMVVYSQANAAADQSTISVLQAEFLALGLRIQTAATGSSITPTVGTADQVNQANTQATGTLTINNPTGTPTDGQRLTIRITSTNVQTYSWGTAYHAASSATLPTASTGGGHHDYIGFIYDAATSQWDYVSSVAGF